MADTHSPAKRRSKIAPACADCGGFDIEWMYRCHKHGLEYCRGCSCPECDEDNYDADPMFGGDEYGT